MHKISVIVPVYNVEKFLAQCLESLIRQTYKNLEIIIIDDGSSDNSYKIYKKYAKNDSRIKIIKQINAGVSAARNAGLASATGEYIHFIDSDDYIDIDYYEKMLSASGSMSPDIIAGGVVSQNAPLYNIVYDSKCVLKTPTEKFLITNALNNCTVWRYLFKRDFLVKNKLTFVTGRIFEDMLFTPNAILLANYIVTVPDAKYYYVFNENSLLNKKYTANHETQYAYAEQQLNQFILDNNLSHIKKRLVNLEITTYKFLIFKFFKRVFYKDNNETKYYLFGIRILKTYKK